MPVYIYGEKGFGKTINVEQACAKLGRTLIRVPISIETDKHDLFGGAELIDGNTVNREGPVLSAMRHGSVLLLDELDRGSNKLICLQSVLEGKPYFNENTGETVYPVEGFTIFATGNTSGFGSEDGRYQSQVMDEAFMDRFGVKMMHQYPSVEEEEDIINLYYTNSLGKKNSEFAKILSKWAAKIRNSDAYISMISTRHLISICKIDHIFNDRKKAVEMSLQNLDEDQRKAYIDMYLLYDENYLKLQESKSGTRYGTASSSNTTAYTGFIKKRQP